MDRFDRKDALNAISGFLAAYGWFSFACIFYLVISWAAVAPHTPNPVNGLIYRHNEHGTITYFSGFQGTSCTLLFTTSLLFFGLGFYLSPKKDVVYKTGKLSFSMRYNPDDPNKIQRLGLAIGAVSAPLIIFFLGPSVVRGLNSIGFVTGF